MKKEIKCVKCNFPLMNEKENCPMCNENKLNERDLKGFKKTNKFGKLIQK